MTKINTEGEMINIKLVCHIILRKNYFDESMIIVESLNDISIILAKQVFELKPAKDDSF